VRQRTWPDAENICVKYDEVSCQIHVGNVLVNCGWNNQANVDYPEDLTWGRDLGNLCHHVASAGARYQYNLMSDEIAQLQSKYEKLVNAINHYLEVQKFLAAPNEDTSASSDDFKQVLKECGE